MNKIQHKSGKVTLKIIAKYQEKAQKILTNSKKNSKFAKKKRKA